MKEPRRPLPTSHTANAAAQRRPATRQPVSAIKSQTTAPNSVQSLPPAAKQQARQLGNQLQRAGVTLQQGTQQVKHSPGDGGGGGARRAVQPVAPNQLTLEKQVASRASVAPTVRPAQQPQQPMQVSKSELGALKASQTPRPSLNVRQNLTHQQQAQKQSRSR